MLGDLVTLTAVAGFVAVMSGAFLVLMGWRYQATSVAAVWGGGSVAAAVALIVFAGNEFFDLGFGCAVVAACLHWSAVVLFCRRRIPLAVPAAAVAIWAAIAFVPLGLALEHRVAIYQLVLAGLLIAAVVELVRGRGEQLSGRWPMVVLISLHAAVFLFGAGLMLVVRAGGGVGELANFVPTIIETMIFCIGTALFMVSLIRERRANEERRAAGVDWLTGIPNRRAFLDQATRVMGTAFATARPVSAIVFDLDLFKRINDEFGHRTGDTVLQRFASLAARMLRRDDLVGRLGGEEFAVLLPGANREQAIAFADRIRVAFAADADWVDGNSVKATVSAGVVVARRIGSVEDLIDRADRALYIAKSKGRDRVEALDDDHDPAVARSA
ncbi:MAG: GGDEF domain-containing protein [Bauldia sp.]|nr:GGDEF domain-containing protein [Bauldia sp.]